MLSLEVLTLPWPPSFNHYWRIVSGRVLISREGRAYRSAVMGIAGCRVGFGAQRLCVTIEASPPDARRRDLDNLQKAVLDALEHAGVYDDDGQIDRLTTIRLPPTKGGSVRVTIRALSEVAA